MTKLMVQRLKKLQAIYGANGLQPEQRLGKDAQPPVRHNARSTGGGSDAGFVERARLRLAQGGVEGACASVIAIDFSGSSWTHGEWMACLNALASYVVAEQDGACMVEMLEGQRFVVFMPGAWEGEAIRSVRQMRSALWRFGPTFGVSSMAPGMGIAEVMERALARAERAAASSVTSRFSDVERRGRMLTSAA